MAIDFERIKAAIALVADGREALSEIASALRDGRAALSAAEADELDAMLVREIEQSVAAHDELAAAIAARLQAGD